MRLQSFWRGVIVLLLGCVMAFPAFAQDEYLFEPQQLEQLVAPIALYPDPLLTQILMASTYPSNVAEAADWSRDHPWLRGDDAVWEVRDYDWDPSVQSLVAFPQVLAMMGGHPSWVRDLGDAFLAQPDDVMDAVQRLRFRAYNAGYLRHARHMRVIVETPDIIQIVLVNPGYLYVPYYDPGVVYGDWPYDDYPPVYFPPPRGYGFPTVVNTGIVFGISITITHALWGECNWARHGVFINVTHYNRFYPQRRIDPAKPRVAWWHDPHFRHDPYPTPVMRSHFQKPQPPLFRPPGQAAPRVVPQPAQRPLQQAPQGLPHREEARPQAIPPVMQHREERPNQPPPQARPRREEQPNQPLPQVRPRREEQPNQPLPQARPRREEQPNQPLPQARPRHDEQPNQPLPQVRPRREEQPNQPLPQARPRREEPPNQPLPQVRPRREEQPNQPLPQVRPRRDEQLNQPLPQAMPRREERPNQLPPQAMPRREERPNPPPQQAMPRREERSNPPQPQARPRREEQNPRQDQQQQHKKPLPEDIERQSP